MKKLILFGGIISLLLLAIVFIAQGKPINENPFQIVLDKLTALETEIHLIKTCACNCAGTEEICDGLDNDCDKEIDEGGVCSQCDNNTQCSYLSQSPVCNDHSTCQGNRTEGICTDGVCNAIQINDDSGCAADLISNDCGLYPSVYCTGSQNQTPPICSSSCSFDSDCDQGAYCDNGSCTLY